MIGRALGVLALFVATAVATTHLTAAEVVVPRAGLDGLPLTIEEWHGRPTRPFSDDIVTELGVDDYVNRYYIGSSAVPLSLYVGYYAQQRQGDAIHSPRNCLPGAGWQPVETGTATLARGVTVNRYVIQKGIDRQVVFYWYQGRGRVVANEYANKALLMLDAARLRRTSGGLVRVILPVTTTVEAAAGELTRFSDALLPHLSKHLP